MSPTTITSSGSLRDVPSIPDSRLIYSSPSRIGSSYVVPATEPTTREERNELRGGKSN